LYAQGICREFYTRANEPGRVVLMFESASIEAAKEALATIPFAQLHLIDFDLIPLAPFTGLSRLFQAASEERTGQRSQERCLAVNKRPLLHALQEEHVARSEVSKVTIIWQLRCQLQ